MFVFWEVGLCLHQVGDLCCVRVLDVAGDRDDPVRARNLEFHIGITWYGHEFDECWPS